MDKNYLLKHWYADIYEQQVIQPDDIKSILSMVGTNPRKILEVACGGGRISVPLAQAGHYITGFDFDEFMLEKIPAKAKGLDNLSFYKADAVLDDWGSGFDVVVLSGNILVNIESDMDYKQAQELFIKKAADSVIHGGYMYLDFDVRAMKDQIDKKRHEWVCFEGTDDIGTFGKYIIISGESCSKTRIDKSYRRYEITPKDSETFIVERTSIKHFPTYLQVESWLKKYGWEIKWHSPIIDGTFHVIIWAEKL